MTAFPVRAAVVITEFEPSTRHCIQMVNSVFTNLRIFSNERKVVFQSVGQRALQGAPMRHDWIFDVLTDLKAYAVANGMMALAEKADEALVVARREVGQAPEAHNPLLDRPQTPKSL